MESSYFDINDTAKQTIKETTIDNKYIGQASQRWNQVIILIPMMLQNKLSDEQLKLLNVMAI